MKGRAGVRALVVYPHGKQIPPIWLVISEDGAAEDNEMVRSNRVSMCLQEKLTVSKSILQYGWFQLTHPSFYSNGSMFGA